jgi:endonuclease/exonuclease/phosphatase family metal-dependent hydrolase
VSLIEVDEPWGHPTALAGLADELDYAWVFVPAFEYRSEGGFGNALLARRPIRAVQQWQLLSPRLYDGTESSEPRTAILARIDAGGYAAWVGSTHLPRHDPAQRTEASGRLLQLLDRLDAPFVVCGDFNQPPDVWLPEGRSYVPKPALATHPSQAPGERIDYCLIEGMSAEAQTLTSTASDHLPLLIELSTSG